MNIEKLQIEDILSKVNIQANLRQLESDNTEDVRSALQTLANIARLSERRDCLVAVNRICGVGRKAENQVQNETKLLNTAFKTFSASTAHSDLKELRWMGKRKLPRDFFRELGQGGWYGFSFADGLLVKRPALREALIAEELARLSPGATIAALAHADILDIPGPVVR